MTRTRVVLVTLAAITLACVAAFAQPAAPEAPPAPTIAQLEWMTGKWQGELFGGVSEETWMPPRGSTMVGVFRLSRAERTSVVELLLIEEDENGVFLRFKHFSPAYRAWEEAPLIFRLEEAGPARAVFESPNPDQKPRRMTYERTGDTMTCLVEGPEAEGDEGSFKAEFTLVED